VSIFAKSASCLRLVQTLVVEIHEEWIEGTRYLNMEFLCGSYGHWPPKPSGQVYPARTVHSPAVAMAYPDE